MAYTYNNYLRACRVRNQLYKKNSLPAGATLFTPPNITSTTRDADIEA